jgi:acylphosphatase
VQGVGFRAATRREAMALGLTGWARNRADGSVEVQAAGTTAGLAALADWLRHGPPLARVEAVHEQPAAGPCGDGFAIG